MKPLPLLFAVALLLSTMASAQSNPQQSRTCQSKGLKQRTS